MKRKKLSDRFIKRRAKFWVTYVAFSLRNVLFFIFNMSDYFCNNFFSSTFFSQIKLKLKEIERFLVFMYGVWLGLIRWISFELYEEWFSSAETKQPKNKYMKSKAHKNCESVQLILLSIISNLVNLLLCSGFKLAFISSFGQIRLVTFGSYCLAYFYQWQMTSAYIHTIGQPSM